MQDLHEFMIVAAISKFSGPPKGFQDLRAHGFPLVEFEIARVSQSA
jgi:hypothetical protein